VTRGSVIYISALFYVHAGGCMQVWRPKETLRGVLAMAAHINATHAKYPGLR
jgi:hypothetical protein